MRPGTKFFLTSTTALLTVFLFLSSASFLQAENNDPIGPSFTENKGQLRSTDGKYQKDVKFFVQHKETSVYVLEDRLSFVFNSLENTGVDGLKGSEEYIQKAKWKMHRVDMQWLGANKKIEIVSDGPTRSTRNYFSSDKENGITDVSNWNNLTLKEIYPKIDLQLYFVGGNLKYDFIVKPGGNPDKINLSFTGAKQMKLQEDGSLWFETPLGEFTEGIPVSYQGDNDVECKYTIESGNIHFETGDYDQSKTLIIDPLREWATYYGGTDYEFIRKTAIGPSGDIYVCGITYSPNFPTNPGAFQDSIVSGGWEDMFISRIDKYGNMVWSTYYGGSSSDESGDIVVDANEEVFVIGNSNSSDFPITVGSYLGGTDIVVLRFDSLGTRISATMFGGTTNDYGFGISSIPGGGTYLTGQTASSDFPISFGCHQATKSGSSDIFLTKLSATGAFSWSTFLGGNGIDLAYDVATDNTGWAVLSGYSYSNNFPTSAGCYQDSITGKNDNVIARFDPNGVMGFSTYFGGSLYEYGWGIAIDDSNNIYSAGETTSPDLVTNPDALNNSLSGTSDFFVVKLDENGTHRWSGYWGGNGVDAAYEIKWDQMGYLHLTGRTNSTDLAVTADAIQDTLGGSYDAPILTINKEGRVVSCSYYGGTDYDAAYGLVANGLGGLFVVGETESTDLPVDATAYQNSASGNWDGWVMKLDMCEAVNLGITPSDEICNGTNGSIDLNFFGGNAPFTVIWSTGDTVIDLIDVPTGSYTFQMTDSIGCQVSGGTTVGASSYTPFVSLGPDTTICKQNTLTLDAGPGFDSYEWQGFTGSQTHNVLNQGLYYVEARDSNNCTTVDSIEVFMTGPTTNFTMSNGGSQVYYNDLTSGAVSWYWDFGDAWFSGSQNPTHTYTSPGTYNVCLKTTDANGCEDIDCQIMTILATGINETITQRLNVYPNPTKGMTVIEFASPLEKNAEWQLIDMQGRVLTQGQIAGNHSTQFELDLSDLPSSVYNVRIDGYKTTRLIVQH